MKHFLNKLSPRTEFLIVIALAFGWPIADAWIVWSRDVRHVTMTDSTLWLVASFELVIGTLVFALLHLRGWKWNDIELNANWRTSLAALPVLFGTLVIALTAGLISFKLLDGHGTHSVQLSSRTTMGAGLIAASINALYEEVFVCAYIIKFFEKYRNALAGLFVSVLIRTSYHAYEGTAAFVFLVPLGLFFGTFYIRYKSLWPLVVAHALYDILAFSIQHKP